MSKNEPMDSRTGMMISGAIMLLVGLKGDDAEVKLVESGGVGIAILSVKYFPAAMEVAKRARENLAKARAEGVEVPTVVAFNVSKN